MPDLPPTIWARYCERHEFWEFEDGEPPVGCIERGCRCGSCRCTDCPAVEARLSVPVTEERPE